MPASAIAKSVLEFHLSITPLGGDDRVLIRTERAPKGVMLAEEQAIWPIEEWLVQAERLMADPLWELFRAEPATDERLASLVALGEQLYGTLFQGSIRDRWISAQSVADSQDAALHLRLGLRGDRLLQLPWEALYGEGRLLTTGTDITFSRYRSQFGRSGSFDVRRLTLRQPEMLRILVALAAPDDQAALAVEQEVDRLRQELSAAAAQMTIDVLDQPDREQLTHALEQGQYHVFHYAGHSDPGPDGGSLHLVNRRTGLAEPLAGNDLAGLLVNNGVWLAFLNSCRGSDSAQNRKEDSTDTLAAALMRRGVPGVLAMSEQIPDDVAITLMQLFYRNLRPDYSLDLATSRMRQGLVSTYGSAQFYWALPTLYLHPDFDGLVFAPGAVTMASPRSPIPAVDEPALPVMPRSGELPRSPALERRTDLPELTDEQLADDRWNDETIGINLSELPNLAAPSTPSQGRSLSASEAGAIDSPAPNSPTESIAQAVPRVPRVIPRTWLAIGATALLLGLGGLWRSSLRPAPIIPSSRPSLIAPLPPKDWVTMSTAELAQMGMAAVRQKQLPLVTSAIEALLVPERNAAAAALKIVEALPQTDANSPDLLYLRGRVAWQLARQNNPDQSFADALRYWQLAINAAPDDARSRLALGFAQWQLDQPNEAESTWNEMLARLEANPNRPADVDARPMALAGLALVAQGRSSQPNAAAESAERAITLRQQVLNEAADRFSPVTVLAQNWLWTEKAIAQWQQLLNQP
ncbi:MAG: CHAT domain-containing protein [Oscillatoriales cyanobacterium]|nr:MAG: CHAT domain-containing protein [Oscillatoriales cyanobacterium]